MHLYDIIGILTDDSGPRSTLSSPKSGYSQKKSNIIILCFTAAAGSRSNLNNRRAVLYNIGIDVGNILVYVLMV